MPNLAINGFGRIGRLSLRVWYQHHQPEASLVAINTSGSMDLVGWAHLLKYDTSYGLFAGEISLEEHQKPNSLTPQDPLLGYLIIDQKHKIPVLGQRDASLIPWSSYQVETVLECTGQHLTQEKASQHLRGSVKHVILSAPAKDSEIITLVRGVKEAGGGDIVSNASCTTNCIAPIMSVLQTSFGVEKAMLNTIHSYTDDQNLQDGSHRDLRRARAGASNIVPTTTGAAQTVGQVIPGFANKFDGLSIRVPTLTASLSDITCLLAKEVTKDELNQAFLKASQSNFQGIIATISEPLVSSDIIGRPESAIIDLELTSVVGGNLIKIIAWYDNEWGFSNRLIEQAIKL
jgi:glyceraldehyde 3-phosphate dehydrogenase